MPSPFPGMDPFLEDTDIFPDFHSRLITHLSDMVQGKLPPPYFSVVGSRVWVDVSSRPILPDVEVRRPTAPQPNGNGATPGSSGGGGVAVAQATGTRTKAIQVHVTWEEKRQTFIAIETNQGGRRLVTVIEILSPTNKIPGPDHRERYVKKQQEILSSNVNLVEIDLLRCGHPTTAVPFPDAVQRAGSFTYHVCVKRFDQPDDFWIYPFQLQDTLPEIAIPLLPDHPGIAVDLQTLFDRCYDLGPYARWVNYAGPVPPPALGYEQGEWVALRLRERGLIPPTMS